MTGWLNHTVSTGYGWYVIVAMFTLRGVESKLHDIRGQLRTQLRRQEEQQRRERERDAR